MKKLVRLTEGDLHRIVKKSVQRIVSEASATPNGFKHRFGTNKRDRDFPISFLLFIRLNFFHNFHAINFKKFFI